MSVIPGTRCRSTRQIVCPGGIVRRSTPGTLVSQRENLGRELFTVDFDSGQKVILFAHEIELERDDLPRRRPAIAAALVAGVFATLGAANARATTFSALHTHSGLTIELAGTPAGKLVSNGWFRRPGVPTYVYREDKGGDGRDVGWTSIDVDPEGGTQVEGDLPPAIPPALAAGAAAAIEGEVALIYADVGDVCPLIR